MEKLYLKKHNYSGTLIVIEGTDGSGKTTLSNYIINLLKNSVNQKIKYIKMPSNRVKNLQIFNDYDNSKNDYLRNTLSLSNLTVFVTGDRLVTLDTEVIPALKNGDIVICDRYCYTGYAKCQDKIIKQLCERFIKPDVIILTTASIELVKQRIQNRENEKDNYFNEISISKEIDVFLTLAKINNFNIIDTQQENEVIHNMIKRLFSKYLLENITNKNKKQK